MKINKELVYKVIHDHKNEILDSQDWWWAIGNNDINIHCLDDDTWEQPNAIYSINLYELNENGTSSYDSSVQYDLPPMTRKEIRLL
jgi:hypothetical protein